jgi:hypothetical protein
MLVYESRFCFLEVEIIDEWRAVLAVGFWVVDDSYDLVVVVTEEEDGDLQVIDEGDDLLFDSLDKESSCFELL